MSPEAQGYLDSWLKRPPKSKDSRYLKAYNDGAADRASAVARPTHHPEQGRKRRRAGEANAGL